MRRWLFLVVVGLLVLGMAEGSHAIEVLFYYTVQPGDCLWSISKKAGHPGIDFEVLVACNKDIFVKGGRSIHRIYAGERLLVPASWAYNLGLVELSAEQPSFNQVSQKVFSPIPPSVVPMKSALEDPIFWFFFIVLVVVTILVWRGDRIRDWVVKVGQEVIYTLMPLKLDPVVAGGIDGPEYASQLFGVRPEDLVLSPVSGTYRANHQRRDGSAYSRVSSVRGEQAYHLPGDTNRVVFRGCGNPAIQLSGERQRVVTQLAERARTGFRSKTPLEPVEIEDNYRPNWDWMETVHDPGLHGYLDEN